MGNNNSTNLTKSTTIYPDNKSELNQEDLINKTTIRIPNSNKNKKFILGIIDPQNDFFEGGTLGVSDSNQILAPINKLRFLCFNLMDTFISQDYHNSDHISFHTTHNKEKLSICDLETKMDDGTILKTKQVLWPEHCIKNTFGCEFHKDLIINTKDKIFRKGTNSNIESYSAFGDEFNNNYENTKLNKWLGNKKITDIILVGLATDYCVYHTALDSIKYGYQVHLILSCIRGVQTDSTNKALDDMLSKGVLVYNDVEDFFSKNHTNFLI